MNEVLIASLGCYLMAIMMGKFSPRPGLNAVLAVAILTIAEVVIVILLMFTMNPPSTQ